jgi:Domain of unknown function (DUF4419)
VHQACHFDGVDIVNDKETLTGWITTFCFWSDSGHCLRLEYIDENTLHHPRRRNSIDEFSHRDEPQIFWDDDKDDWYSTKVMECKKVFIEEVKCHYIFPKNIPNGTATALLYVRDYSIHRMIHSTTIVAGSMGTISTRVGYLADETLLQPRLGWFLLQDEQQAMPPLQQPKVLIEDGHELYVLD